MNRHCLWLGHGIKVYAVEIFVVFLLSVSKKPVSFNVLSPLTTAWLAGNIANPETEVYMLVDKLSHICHSILFRLLIYISLNATEYEYNC